MWPHSPADTTISSDQTAFSLSYFKTHVLRTTLSDHMLSANSFLILNNPLIHYESAHMSTFVWEYKRQCYRHNASLLLWWNLFPGLIIFLQLIVFRIKIQPERMIKKIFLLFLLWKWSISAGVLSKVCSFDPVDNMHHTPFVSLLSFTSLHTVWRNPSELLSIVDFSVLSVQSAVEQLPCHRVLFWCLWIFLRAALFPLRAFIKGVQFRSYSHPCKESKAILRSARQLESWDGVA